jgi:hypothetical protein
MRLRSSRDIVAILLALAAGACAPKPMLEVSVPQPLGESWVTTALYRAGHGDHLFFFNMHENEATSVQAGLELIRRRGGRLLMLRQNGERLLRFDLDGETFTVDPNRIFTDHGASQTLARYSRDGAEARSSIRAFAENLITDYGLDTVSLVVTLHNNTDGEYSAAGYLPGGTYAADAARVHMVPGQDPDDFFFVTEDSWFEHFAAAHFNVVLQDNTRVTDDGSLSVLAARRGIPYINVEAQHGHLKQQRRMLQALERAIRRGLQ